MWKPIVEGGARQPENDASSHTDWISFGGIWFVVWRLKAGHMPHARSHAAYHQFLSRCPIAFPRPRSPVLGGHVSAHDAACLNFDFRSAIPIRDVIRYGFNHLTVPGARPVPKPNTRQGHGPFAPRAVDGCGVEQTSNWGGGASGTHHPVGRAVADWRCPSPRCPATTRATPDWLRWRRRAVALPQPPSCDAPY